MRHQKGLLLTGLLLILVLLYVRPVYAQDNCVYLTVEKLTLSQGYLIEPECIPIQDGDNYARIVTRALNEAGYGYSYTGSSDNSFYLGSIDGADNGYVWFPNAVTSLGTYQIGDVTYEAPANDGNSINQNYPALGEFAYTNMSGWIYSVNGAQPSVGMSDVAPQAGEVIRLQFSVFGYGADLGNVYRDALIAKVAQIREDTADWFLLDGCENAYYQAMEVLQNLDASQGDVDAALAALPAQMQLPQELWFSADEQEIQLDGDLITLNLQYAPENTNILMVTYESSNPEIASVDENGTVTPQAAGDAVITAVSSNGVVAYCTIHVIGRPLTNITLNSSDLSLEYDPVSSFQLKIVSFEPEDTTDSLENIVWSSADEGIASVDGQGLVTGRSAGDTTITATAVSGVEAVCTVHVSPSEAVVTELEQLIQALPEAVDLTISNETQVSEAQERYAQSSDAVKERISSELTEKLQACAARMQELKTAQTNAREVERLIRLLPGSEKVLPEDEAQITAARNAYDALTEEEKAMVADVYLQKLLACEMILQERKQEAATLEGILEAARKVVDGKGQKEEDNADFFEKIKNLDSISSQIIQNYGADKLEVIEQAKETIGTAYHTDGMVSAELPWYVKLSAEVQNSGVCAQFQTILRKNSGAERAEIVALYQLSFTDMQTGAEYATSQGIKVKIKNQSASSQINPQCFIGTKAIAGGYAASIAAATFDLTKTVCTITLNEAGYVGIADVPISLKGIVFENTTIRLDVRENTTLSVKKVPENATDATSYTFQSSNTAIATVNASGKVTAKAEGSAKITVSCKQGYKAVCSIVVSKTANSVSIHTVEEVMKKTAAYMIAGNSEPGLTEQWPVIGMARSGMVSNKQYFSNFYNNAAASLAEVKGVLTDRRYTDYAKLILSMTAIGKDARDINGYNLFHYLADMENVKKQGNNGPIWALIALKSNPEYSIPKVSGVAEQTTEEGLLAAVLGMQLSDGGWTLSGASADVDMTAMALQSLAPWYQKDAAVTAAIEKGLSCLSGLQKTDGGFESYGAANVESTAQVIVALTALGINPAKDSRFIKRGSWTVEVLLDFYVEGGGFSHLKGGKVNGMATEQGYYALSSYIRLLDGKTSLYDMSDINLSKGSAGVSTTEKQTETKTSEKTTEKTTEQTEKKTPSGSSKKATGGSKSATGGSKAATEGSTAGNKKTTAQTDKNNKEKKKAKETEGWAFQGPEYNVETAESGATESVQSPITAIAKGGGWKAAVVGILGVILAEAIVYLIYRIHKKRKDRDKKDEEL